eukprot:TRINITY_DN1472_c0_g1_i3.p1 TRINITY_DN1472_c0_g1~~TRINITY_DN1472_c0_g1_i3.p1  ORF type:complete len:129 (+),score=43.49 TRINITY_DN1472_c0_g1_i3:782-1168(+)
MLSLQSLIVRLQEMKQYLTLLESGTLPVNNTIVRQIQEAFNLIPNLNNPELVKAFMIKSNDNMVAIYLSSLVRSVTALHDLINNKLEFREAEYRGESGKDQGKKQDKEKEGAKKEGEKKVEGKTEEKK